MCAVFPHAAACPENLPGDREIPDHPLVKEVIHDCLHEAMDLDGLKNIIGRIFDGKIELVAKDTVEPSALAGEILSAKKYSFLDDARTSTERGGRARCSLGGWAAAKKTGRSARSIRQPSNASVKKCALNRAMLTNCMMR